MALLVDAPTSPQGVTGRNHHQLSRRGDKGREMGAVYLTKPYIRAALCNAIDKAVTSPAGW